MAEMRRCLPIQGGVKRWTVGDPTRQWWWSWARWLVEGDRGLASIRWAERADG